ncbi:MAG TPA: hypothetical protein VFE58_02495 [Tepidisphaeraceae bacterium]|jgi:hypothetical protein|nr:hypothetical protein [Tepidisphaeraceae bacterium]
MPAIKGTDPLSDDELIYRRIPVSQNWYNPNLSPPLSPKAFNPTERDVTGLSISRASLKTIEEAAKGQPGKSYYVAILRVADLRSAGIRVEPKPLDRGVLGPDHPGDESHAELPDLTYQNRKEPRVEELKLALAQRLCIEVNGPYHS